MDILRAADRVATPWKNGGGETSNVAVYPEGAGLSDFDWRVSIARVDGDGPFSSFPGIDRTLTILSGGAMALNGVVLTPESAPFSFDGERPVMATVSGGPIHDLNVMTRRGRFTHRVERVAGPRVLPAAAGMRMLLALDDGGLPGLSRWDAWILPAAAVHIAAEGDLILITLTRVR
ncbi:HutD family protein [Niveispirillum sp. KHB5.9]|uniref:HutD/Ves family protein n=1 Tax=Niveispirillum sp. KHB5.9 TaxID=3400269 RepID=UPI003A887F76